MESSILSNLNEAQKAAVVSTHDVVQILAPPGSGKTKTLTSRVAYLLDHHGYKPWNILCLTFTIKSAKEMKERIARLIGNGLESKLVLGTFHSVCRRYLVSYGRHIGLKKGFGIADSNDSQAIVTRIVKRLKLNIDPRAARARVSSSKSRGVSYHELQSKAEASKKSSVDSQEFVRVFEEYELHLATSNLLDYDDLLLRCVDLLQANPYCVSNVEAVLIDEFQDTNSVQYQLMNLFASKNKRITTVGDPDQSIYGWRSAEILNLARMRKLYPDTLVVNLEENYRSSAAIILAAQEVIEQDESRPPKLMQSTHCPGTIPTFRKLSSAYIEADWLVSELKRCIALCGNELLKLSDFAILLRSASLSRQIESAMGKSGIPYRMVGGLRFFDRAEVKILLDYMRAVSQPDNSDALARILNVPKRGIGDQTIKLLLEEATMKKITLYCLIKDSVQGHRRPATKLSKNMEQGLSALMNILLGARNKLTDGTPFPPHDLLEYVLKRLSFKEWMGKTYQEDHEARWANVEELMAQATDSALIPSSDVESEEALPAIEGLEQDVANGSEEALTKFLANVALATEIQKEEDINAESGGLAERVTISTIHAAKGLEWPVVFIPAAYEGIIPHSRAEDSDEERRLLYVAMTRAKALLFMSCPMKSSTGGDEVKPSPFLTTRKVMHHLVDKGPSLCCNTVSDIARILGRECPSQQALDEGYSAASNTEDDQWPLNGEADPEAVAARWARGATDQDDYHYKRRKIERERDLERVQHVSGATIGYKTTTATIKDGYSCTVSGFTSGFTTAASQLAATRSATAESIGKQQVKSTMQSSNQDQVKKTSTQHTLAAFFAPQAKKPTAPTECLSETGKTDSLPEESTLPSLPRQAPPAFSPHLVRPLSTSSRPPVGHIPASLAKHSFNARSAARPKVVHDEAPAERQYVFLSSSPPKAPAMPQRSEDTIANEQKQTAAVSKPASTFHNTSMAQAGARKTLGMRRSMVGWKARPARGKGFVAPRMGGG